MRNVHVAIQYDRETSICNNSPTDYHLGISANPANDSNGDDHGCMSGNGFNSNTIKKKEVVKYISVSLFSSNLPLSPTL